MNRTTENRERIFLIPLLAILLILSAPLSAIALAQADPPIQDLYSAEYFPTVHQEFQNARESIVVTMYQIRLYPNSTDKSPTFILVRDLIDAHKRGVKVTVILNNPYRQHRTEEAASSKEVRLETHRQSSRRSREDGPRQPLQTRRLHHHPVEGLDKKIGRIFKAIVFGEYYLPARQ